MRHRCEAKQRLRVGAGRTCSCLEGPCRAQINFDLHDQLYLISRKCVASKAPEPRCRQSIRRRRRPSTCSRCCRMPQHRPATAKTASKKLSLATTTGLKTPLRWRVLRDYFASRSTMCAAFPCRRAAVFRHTVFCKRAAEPWLATLGRAKPARAPGRRAAALTSPRTGRASAAATPGRPAVDSSPTVIPDPTGI